MTFRTGGGPPNVVDAAVVLPVGAAVTRTDVPDLCARLSTLVDGRAHGVVLDGAGPELRELPRLAGLAGESPEVGRQPEEREQPGGVEEVADPGDPAG